MMRLAILTLSLLVTSCAAAPSGLHRASTGELQPLDPGLEWIYEAEGRTQTRRVVGVERVGRFECHVIEARTGQDVERTWIRSDRDGLRVYRVSDGERTVDFDDPVVLIHRLAAPGATWNFEETHGPLTLAVDARYEADDEITVADRVLRCARIRLVKRAAGRVMVDQTCWYAPDVGLVRMTVVVAGEEGETRTTLRLKSCNFISE
jgi:hypothetical protein